MDLRWLYIKKRIYCHYENRTTPISKNVLRNASVKLMQDKNTVWQNYICILKELLCKNRNTL